MSRLATIAILVGTFTAGALLRDQAFGVVHYATGLLPYRLAVVSQSPPRQTPPSAVGRMVTRY